MKSVLRILIVEDSEDDALLVLYQIKKGGYEIEYDRVDTAQKMEAALKEKTWDIILSDYQMPHFNGLEALVLYNKTGIDIPFILVSGTIGEEVAVNAMKTGAHDYIMKNNLQRLLPAIERELRESENRAERKLAEKKLKESEERYRLISNVTSDYMFSTIVNPDGSQKVNWLAGAFEAITSYTIEEYIALGGWSYILYPDDREQDKKDFLNLIKNRQVITEIRNVKKNGEIYWVKVYAHPVWDNLQNRLTSVYGAVQDITERKKAEEATYKLNLELESLVKERTIELENTNDDLQKEVQIRAAAEDCIKHQLQEKEILLKEIHHRVKNNMQIIISMLSLQASFIKDKKIITILQDSQSRIKTMALIHEKLYQAKNLESIDFTEYLNNLCGYLFTSYISSDRQVKYSINAGKYTLEIDTTISLGLITNELITNSFKYAFIDIDNRECIIQVVLKKFNDKNLEFSISDNGKGLPENFDYRNSQSLGLQLVCMLTEQISGKLEVTSSNMGTTFSIIFPYKN